MKSKKKNKKLNTKILNQITNKVKFDTTIEQGKEEYHLYQKNFEGKWILLISTNRISKLLQRKHNAWRLTIYSMGKLGFFKERKKKRERQRKERLKKIS